MPEAETKRREHRFVPFVDHLSVLRAPSCPFVDFFFWVFVDNPQLFQASRAPALLCGSFEEKRPIVDEDEPRMDTNKHE